MSPECIVTLYCESIYIQNKIKIKKNILYINICIHTLKKNIVNFNKYLVEYLPTKYLLNIKIYLLDTRNVNLI